MKETALKNDLISILYKAYDSEVFAPIIEFLQGETRVMLYLYMNNEIDIYPTDLSSALPVSRQRITSILSSLRNKGYITMDIEENDRRKMKVHLTETGEGLMSQKTCSANTQIDKFISRIGDRNIKELIRITDLMLQQ